MHSDSNANFHQHEFWLTNFELMKRERRFEEAQQLISRRFGEQFMDVDSGLLQAQYLNEVKAFNESYAVYEKLLSQDLPLAQQEQIRLAYARLLFNHGLGKRALRIISAIGHESPIDPAFKSHALKIGATCRLLENLEQRPLGDQENTRILAFKHALLSFADRQVRAIPVDRVGRLVLLTGSLGGGGAERQLSGLAIGLTRLYQQGGGIAGLPVDQPVDLVIASLDSSSGKDFFLPEVLESGCRIHEIDAMPKRPNLKGMTDDKSMNLLLQHQPSHVAYGLTRLVDFFQQTKPDCVAVWQDGACLYTVLAALLAGVPKIQIGMRGLPTVTRKHLHRPEYQPMYEALDHVPGVDFLTNSAAVAQAYSQWLGIPLQKFHIVYNGVNSPVTQIDPQAMLLWRSFVAATPDATRTIGGVFRFATDKRPNVWIRFAQKCLARYPDSRFVIVGAGGLMESAREFARKLGIERRVLFVGATKNVGFWLDQFDVLVLMSQFEGLPNVLIEAQLKSVPVVTTPAGGACECFVDGVSGLGLEAVEPVNFQQAVAAAVDLADSSKEDLFTPQVKTYLHENFAVEAMIERFVKVLRTNVPEHWIRHSEARCNPRLMGPSNIDLYGDIEHNL
jgi:glycosyltransferase involved in cell wall biosynthesis